MNILNKENLIQDFKDLNWIFKLMSLPIFGVNRNSNRPII